MWGLQDSQKHKFKDKRDEAHRPAQDSKHQQPSLDISPVKNLIEE